MYRFECQRCEIVFYECFRVLLVSLLTIEFCFVYMRRYRATSVLIDTQRSYLNNLTAAENHQRPQHYHNQHRLSQCGEFDVRVVSVVCVCENMLVRTK